MLRICSSVCCLLAIDMLFTCGNATSLTQEQLMEAFAAEERDLDIAAAALSLVQGPASYVRNPTSRPAECAKDGKSCNAASASLASPLAADLQAALFDEDMESIASLSLMQTGARYLPASSKRVSSIASNGEVAHESLSTVEPPPTSLMRYAVGADGNFERV